MKKRLLLPLLTLLLVAEIATAQECIFNFCDFDYGIQVYQNNERYIGQFFNRERSGQGVYIFANGDKYVGTWEKDVFNGEGRLYLANGSVQAGTWKNGVLAKPMELKSQCLHGDCENGYGVYLFENGTKLAASFNNGQPVEQVVVFYPNGAKYVGLWENRKKEGLGTLYHANGTIEEGLWHQDLYSGATKSAKGCISGDCKNGTGVYVYRDNTKYDGSFYNSLAHGKGRCLYPDGSLYVGEWKLHNFDGYGEMHYSNGVTQKGMWRGGEYLGPAASATPSRSTAAGEVNKAPKVWAVLVGVARYNHMKSLKYTDDDAYRMYAFLKSPEGGALADDQIRILIDEDATKVKILETLRKTFSQAGPNDVVVFYFSGHGLKGSFLPIDFDGNNNKVEHSEITQILSECKAKSKVVIADACHSGSWYAAKGSAQSTIETYYEAFSRSSGGTVLMMSSKAEETSIENNGLRQGIFSHFLIRGLKGAADKDYDKIVTITELFEYVEANVVFYTNNYQTPVINGNYDLKMPLGVLRD